MRKRYTASHWSIELASGWMAETREDTDLAERCEFVAIVSEKKDALLRLTPDNPKNQRTSAEDWVEFAAHAYRSMGRAVSSIRCGDFTGCEVEFVSGDEWLRGWMLHAGLFQIDACYRCDLKNAGRDDPSVDRMLNTLRAGGPDS